MARGNKIFYITSHDALAEIVGMQVGDLAYITSDARQITPISASSITSSDDFQYKAYKWNGSSWISATDLAFTDENIQQNLTFIRRSHMEEVRNYVRGLNKTKACKYGDFYINVHDFTNAILNWNKNNNSARVFQATYGSDGDFLTIESNSQSNSGVIFAWRNSDQQIPIVKLTGLGLEAKVPFISEVEEGIAPLTTVSQAVCNNLNSDMVDDCNVDDTITTSKNLWTAEKIASMFNVAGPPNAPLGLALVPGTTQLTLNWAAPIVDQTHSAAITYSIYFTDEDIPFDTGSWTKLPDTFSTTYNHTGLDPYTTYYYVVVASNTEGTGGQTEIVSGQPQIPTVHGSWDTVSSLLSIPIVNYEYTVEPFVTQITIEAYGSGGGGAGTSKASVYWDGGAGSNAYHPPGGGGGGGGYASRILAVTPGQKLYINLGAGGAGGQNAVRIDSGWVATNSNDGMCRFEGANGGNGGDATVKNDSGAVLVCGSGGKGGTAAKWPSSIGTGSAPSVYATAGTGGGGAGTSALVGVLTTQGHDGQAQPFSGATSISQGGTAITGTYGAGGAGGPLTLPYTGPNPDSPTTYASSGTVGFIKITW